MTWGKVTDDIFLLLGLGKCEWLEETERENGSFRLIYVVCRGVY